MPYMECLGGLVCFHRRQHIALFQENNAHMSNGNIGGELINIHGTLVFRARVTGWFAHFPSMLDSQTVN